MIEFMKSWIINISVGVFFILAVEMILPSNSLKKYVKFVLGLILIVIIINPVIKLINKDADIKKCININKYVDEKLYKNTYDEYKYKNIENTSKIFECNLQKEFKEKLKSKYPNNDFDVKIKAKYDEKDNSFKISSLDIGVKKSNLVKKVEIKTNSPIKKKEKDNLNDNFAKDIKSYINLEFKIPLNIINIYKI